MKLQVPTAADWAAYEQFCKQEFVMRPYALVSDGAVIVCQEMTDHDAGERNQALRRGDHEARWMRAHVPPPLPSLEPATNQRTSRSMIKAGLIFIFLTLVGIVAILEHTFD